MKSFVTLLLLAVTGLVSAQVTSYQDFKIENQEIIYQKVFTQDSITVQQLEDYYKSLPNVSKMEIHTNGVEFEIGDITVDYAKFQFSQVATPMIIQTGKYSGKVSVELRAGRYRVTFKSIKLTGNIVYKTITEKEELTTYACRNSGTVISQDWTKPNMLGLLNQALSDKFQVVIKEKSDW